MTLTEYRDHAGEHLGAAQRQAHRDELRDDGAQLHRQGTDVHTKDLQPGDTATLDLKGVKAGSYTVICAISGHEQLGMQAKLVIGGGSGAIGCATTWRTWTSTA